MLRIFTDTALTQPLSVSYKGKVTSISSNVIGVDYDTSRPLIKAGDLVCIMTRSGLVDKPILRTVTAVVSTATSMRLTLNSAPTGAQVNQMVFKYDMENPDYVTGPGSNFGTKSKTFYIGVDPEDPQKRYKNIIVSVDGTPPSGVTVELSADGSNWSTSISVAVLGYSGVKYRTIYRRITANSSKPLDVSWLKYKIEADEYLDYGYNPEA